MTNCRYPENSDLFLLPCPNCHSTNIQEGGDDFDGDVGCNDCTLTTPVFIGTKSAINAWNKRKYMDRWIYLDDGEKAREFMIMI